MDRTEFRVVVDTARELHQSNSMSLMWLLRAVVVTVVAISLSFSTNPFVWFAGQLVYVAALYNWFSILHDTGHGSFQGNEQMLNIGEATALPDEEDALPAPSLLVAAGLLTSIALRRRR